MFKRRLSVLTAIFALVAGLLPMAAGVALADSASIDFDAPTYTIGTINGQDGWSSLGAAGSGCAVYDHAVAPSGGGQALRISNAVTSGCFGDQTFSKSLANEAGETLATNGGFSGGVRQSHFEAQFDIASAVPGAQQPGLFMSVSPDRGDGARMSYLGISDEAGGLSVLFYDVQQPAPCAPVSCANFVGTTVASNLDRAAPHTLKFSMDFINGPSNDVVKIYVDGGLVHTGGSWEDYFRYDPEAIADQHTHTVDSLIFRTGGDAAPATLGNGYLIDNLALSTSTLPAPVTTVVTASNMIAKGWLFYNDEIDVVDPTLGSFVTGPGTPALGTGSAQISVTGTQRRNLATYQFAGTPLAEITALRFRTYNPSAGNPGPANRSAYLNFNVDFNGSDTWQKRLVFVPRLNGAVVQNTWQEWDAISSGNAFWSYSGATWPAPNAVSGTTLKTWAQILSDYPGVRIRVTDAHLGLRVGEPYADGYTENIDSFTFGTAFGTTIFDFEPTPQCTADCYANGTTGNDAFDGSTATSAKKTIQAAVNQVSAGGTVHVAAGTYVENVVIPKPLTLTGAGQATTMIRPATSAPNPCPGSSLCGGAASNIILVQADDVTITGFTLDGDNPLLTSGIVRMGAGPGADLDARNGIITDHDLGTFNGLEVHHVTVRNIYLRGIYASSGGTFDFHDNTVTNVQGDYYSIAMFAYDGPGRMVHNTVSWANDGVSANHSKGIQFLDNTVTNSFSGVHTDNAGDGGGVADVISGNIVSDCQTEGYGVWVFVPYIAPAVEDNTVSNCLIGLGAYGGAFAPSSTVTTSFSNNHVDGGGLTGSIGIQVLTTTFDWGDTDVSVAFDHNTVVNATAGVQIEETAGEGAIASALFAYNVIAGNDVGMVSTTAAATDAENNWWGCSGGPADTAHCNGVSGNVDADPWLVDRLTANPIAITSSGTIAADFTWNSDGVQPGGTVPDGTSVTFSIGGGGTISSPAMTTTTGGHASATILAGGTVGVYDACGQAPTTIGAVECIFFAVYDPSAGFVTGGGWFTSPAGSLTADATLTGKATFGFVSKYKKGATVPSGSTQFEFKAGNFKFDSTSYDWLVVSGARAQYKGSGTVNGTGSYRFLLTVTDGQVSGGGGVDRIRIKIWDNATGQIVYDNQVGVADTADATTAIGGGSIVIHK